MREPFQGGIVTFHDRDGVIRYSVITDPIDSVDSVAVRVGALPPITDRMRCHLDGYQPGGYEARHDVPHGDQPGQWSWPL